MTEGPSCPRCRRIVLTEAADLLVEHMDDPWEAVREMRRMAKELVKEAGNG